MFLLGTATTFAGAFLAACGETPTSEVAATEVPVGGAVIMGHFIFAQPTEGQYVAYSSRCPHQNNFITQVEGDLVRCTAHNSVFSVVDGAAISGLTADPLRPAVLTEEGERLTASL